MTSSDAFAISAPARAHDGQRPPNQIRDAGQDPDREHHRSRRTDHARAPRSAGVAHREPIHPVRQRRSAAATATLALLTLATLLAPPPAARATTDARALLDDAARKNGTSSWRDRTLDVTIESLSGDGVTRTRTAHVEELRDADGGLRTFMEFTSPSDVEGTLYLHLAPKGDDEQEWIYTPAARRPRRLTPGQTDEMATGAELGYREVERAAQVVAWTDADAEASLLADETIDGRTYRVVRLTPRAPRPGEAESFDVWLGADDLLVRKLAPRGGTGTPKEILLSEYETIDGHATPRVIEARGPDGAWRTVFRLSDVRYDTGLKESAFSLARLNRGR
jgi:hypothetical protein